MTREEIHKNILNGLLNCTDEFGERIADRYTSSQMNDFANTITAFFPSNLFIYSPYILKGVHQIVP